MLLLPEMRLGQSAAWVTTGGFPTKNMRSRPEGILSTKESSADGYEIRHDVPGKKADDLVHNHCAKFAAAHFWTPGAIFTVSPPYPQPITAIRMSELMAKILNSLNGFLSAEFENSGVADDFQNSPF